MDDSRLMATDSRSNEAAVAAQLRAENRALRDSLATVGDLALAGEVPLDELLQRIVDTARALLRARYAALGVFDAGGTITRFIVSGISPEVHARIGPLPRGAGLLGHIMTERRVVRVARIADHPTSVGFPANHPPMTSFLGGPIERHGVVYGNLYLTERIGAAEFSPADEELLVFFARQSAIVIENARRFARSRQDEQTAQIERSSLEAIFDSLQDAVFTTDLEGRIVRLNRRASAWAGTAAIGRRVAEAF